jgi:hypothetical protein
VLPFCCSGVLPLTAELQNRSTATPRHTQQTIQTAVFPLNKYGFHLIHFHGMTAGIKIEKDSLKEKW